MRVVGPAKYTSATAKKSYTAERERRGKKNRFLASGPFEWTNYEAVVDDAVTATTVPLTRLRYLVRTRVDQRAERRPANTGKL